MQRDATTPNVVGSAMFWNCCVRADSSVQRDATTPNIVGSAMFGIVVSMLAVVCKEMQQLPTVFGPAVHHGKYYYNP